MIYRHCVWCSNDVVVKKLPSMCPICHTNGLVSSPTNFSGKDDAFDYAAEDVFLAEIAEESLHECQ